MKRTKNRKQASTVPPETLSAPLVAQVLEKTQIAKYHTKGGHGFSAEDANNFSDALRGKQVEAVGISNELNGADRIVDGLKVQSKYFQTASDTVASAFDSASGSYRYSGQVLEVPKDQYEACVELMRSRITQGRVPGVDNPADAEKIIRRGTVTYKQALNIARAGNVDSLLFDAQTQAVTSSYVFAVSFIAAFVQNRCQGVNAQQATRAALENGLAAGGTTFLTGVVSAQILRTKAAAIGVVTVRSGLKAVSTTTIGREAIQRIAAGSLGKAVYGAAAVNHVSKLLRSNAVTGTIAAIVTSSPDFYRALFDRSISWRQFTKNLSVNVAGVIGGSAGWIGGAAFGATVGSIVPVLGTAVGGAVGGILGALGVGIGISSAAKAIADRFADDDSEALLPILQSEIELLCFEYLLTEKEVERIAGEIGRTANSKWLRRMFKATKDGTEDKMRGHVRREFEPNFETILRERPKVFLPTTKEVETELLGLIETIAVGDIADDQEVIA